jgi:hypothetical protein
MIACFLFDLRAENGSWTASLVRCCMNICEERKRREPCEQGSCTYMVRCPCNHELDMRKI